MHDLESSLLGLLLSNAGVTGVVGNRIYPGAAPGDTRMPVVVYTLTSREQARHMTGLGAPVDSTVSISAIGDTYQQTVDTAEAIIKALDKFSGRPEYNGDAGVHFISSRVHDINDNLIRSPDGKDFVGFEREFKVRIWYKE